MIFSKKTFFAGLSLLFSTSVNAQIALHGAWASAGNSRYAVHIYDFSATTQWTYSFMTVPEGSVKYVGYSLNQPDGKCFYVRSSGGTAVDTKIWSEAGTVPYSDDRQNSTDRHAGFMWWSGGLMPFNFRIAAYSPTYNSGQFRFDVNEITSATTAPACSLYTTNVSFLRGTTVQRYF